jgi:hypothetical protein
VAPLLWHHIAKDEDVAPAWDAVRLAKPPLWEETPGIWDLRDESVPGGLDPICPSNRRSFGGLEGQNLRLLWHVLMFVDAYALHGLFGRTSQKEPCQKREALMTKAFHAILYPCCGSPAL